MTNTTIIEIGGMAIWKACQLAFLWVATAFAVLWAYDGVLADVPMGTRFVVDCILIGAAVFGLGGISLILHAAVRWAFQHIRITIE